ncbi:MAG TPA: peptide chain release factor N(5)-glutamine methyltransferase [Usitatibacter sp.]|nr:peptide chain release factor N(5)-glutamine methyltransferase [Usitatibacter sp.]
MFTIKAALEEASISIDRIDAQVIMAHMLGVNRAYLASHPMQVLTESQDARIDLMVAQRAMGMPVAYLVGKREFYSREFEVCPDVLIPRPETETLIEAAIRHAGNPATALDLGTGSGIVAITLACELPQVSMTAIDSSAAALAIARANAKAHNARVELLEGEWYAPVAGRRFDLIVSNPPYVAGGDPHLVQGDLRFEPRHALTDGSGDGLDSIRHIVAGARAHLNPGGAILIEHGYDQAEAVAALLARAGFADLASIKDLAGIPRVAGGKLGR